MNVVNVRQKLALVVIDTESLTFTRYVGTQQDRIVSGAPMSAAEVEWFRINPTDFIRVSCGPEAA